MAEITVDLLHQLFEIDFHRGSMVWREPLPRRPELFGLEAGYVCEDWPGVRYQKIMILGKTYKRSRLIYFAYHGEWPEPTVDHFNRDSMDDRISNLRPATRAENNQNRSIPKLPHNQHLPIGVTVTPAGNYRARVNRKHIGTYRTADEAGAAYRTLRSELDGTHCG